MALLFELLADGLLVLLQGVLHLGHLLFIDSYDNIWAARLYLASGRVHRLSSRIHIKFTARKGGELLPKTCDLVVEFTNHSIFRVLINARFVLDMLGT